MDRFIDCTKILVREARIVGSSGTGIGKIFSDLGDDAFDLFITWWKGFSKKQDK